MSINSDSGVAQGILNMNPLLEECPVQFNVSTSLLDCNGYRKRMKENTDVYRRQFDMVPKPMCFMQGVTLQGFQGTGNRMPPPSLLDIESSLRRGPLIEEDNNNSLEDLHAAKPPAMPKELSNRLVIPECESLLKQQTTKIRRTEFPQFTRREDLKGHVRHNYGRPGMQTRMAMKDAFKDYEKRKAANSNIYGISKFDRRPLTAMPDIECHNGDSNLGCMTIGAPGTASLSGTVFDPSATFKDTLQNGTLKASSNSLISEQTRNAAKALDPNASYLELLREPMRKRSCNIRFYNYDPKC